MYMRQLVYEKLCKTTICKMTSKKIVQPAFYKMTSKISVQRAFYMCIRLYMYKTTCIRQAVYDKYFVKKKTSKITIW